jgi:BolA protein
MKQRIEEKLQKNLRLKFLEVKNNSHLHKDHIEGDESGETHFEVIVQAEDLEGLSRVQAQRKINQILKDEFAKGLHALEIRVK